MCIFLQHLIDLCVRSANIPARQHDFGQTIATLDEFGRARDNLFVNFNGVIRATDRGIEVGQHRAAFGFVFIEFRQGLISCLRLVEMLVYQVEAGQHETRIAADRRQFDGFQKFRFRSVGPAGLGQEFSILRMRQ